MTDELQKNPRGDYTKGQEESIARIMNNQPLQDGAALREGEQRLERVARENLARADRSVRGER